MKDVSILGCFSLQWELLSAAMQVNPVRGASSPLSCPPMPAMGLSTLKGKFSGSMFSRRRQE